MKRDPDFINSNLYIKDNKLYTKKKTIIEFPKQYGDKDLLTMEDNIFLFGVFAIIIDDKYSVSTIPTIIKTTPLVITEVVKDDEAEYIQFCYGKDAVIIENLDSIRNDILSYNVFELFYISGKIPWFLEYRDLVKLLDNMPRYADSGIGASFIANEVICSFLTRIKNDKTKFYRLDTTKPYTYVDLFNVYYSAISTLNKVAGSYFTEGLTSALVNKEKKPTRLENLVRS